MTLFVPAVAAQPLSQALWALSRPVGVRRAGETRYLFRWLDALDGSRWLVVNPEYDIPVHNEAVLGGIADILAPWVGHGLVADDITALDELVVANRGKRITVYDAFPQFFKGLSRTLEEMIAAGLLVGTTPPA